MALAGLLSLVEATCDGNDDVAIPASSESAATRSWKMRFVRACSRAKFTQFVASLCVERLLF